MTDVTGWIEVGLGALALVVTGLLFRADRKRRSLNFIIVENRSIVTETKFDVEVRHEGQTVASPRLIVWRVANGGSDPIPASDIENPLSLRIDGAKVLSAEVTHTRPRDLALRLEEVAANRVTIQKGLLNSFDLIEIQTLVDGNPLVLNVEGRVTGVSEIRRSKVPQTSWGTPWRFSWFDRAVVWASGILFILIGAWFYSTGESWITRSFGIAVLVLSIGVNPWLIWRRNRTNRLFLGD